MLPIAFGLVLLVSLAGCGLKDVATPIDSPQALTLLHSAVRKDANGRRSIVGTIRNDSRSAYQYVQVEFNLFDKSGHGVGSTLAKTGNLGPGRTWDFAAPVPKKQAYRYKMDDLTGY